MGKYRVLGSLLDRVFRNNLNANFDDVDVDIQAQKKRVDDLIIGTPQPSEIVDSRGGFPVLRDRLDNVDSSLADYAKQVTSVRMGDLSNLLQQHGKNVVITGDSLAYNRYDFDNTYRQEAYDCFPGMLSWSFMLRDAIHRNDQFFKHGDEIPFRNIKATSAFATSSESGYVMPFNGKMLTATITDNLEEVIIPFSHFNSTNKAVLYMLSNPDNTACSFDVYVDGVLKTSVNNNGTGKTYRGYEPINLVIDLNGDNNIHEIKLTNFVQTATTPEATGIRKVHLLGIGTKLTNVYLTGSGGRAAAWIDSYLNERILNYNPDLLILILGANDRNSYTVASFETYYRDILTRVRAARPDCQIVLLTPTSSRNPADPESSVSPYKPDSLSYQYIDVIKKAAIDFGCYYLDLIKLFNNIPISEWRYDEVHMTKYGNTILARTILDLLMPNGLHTKRYVDSKLIFTAGVNPTKPEQIHGWVYALFSSDFYISSQSANSCVLSVTKNSGRLKVTFRYGTSGNKKNGFIYGATAQQYGSAAQLLQLREYTSDLNSIEFLILKYDGTVLTDADLTTYATSLKFLVTF